ncbi:MAG: DUF4340 domain-containing protein [Vicinamibacteria bacterium]|jgi:hypothetical protein|nr:DUF4340 domain-containing protein [Vicinamibacteria bacterium]
MKGPFLKTGIVVSIAVALGIYFFRVEYKRPAASEKTKEKVFTFDSAKVKEITLKSLEGEPIQLVRDGAAWRLVAPLAAPADTLQVDAVISGLTGLEILQVVADQVSDLSEYGLGLPKVTVAVTIEGAKEPIKLQIGDEAPIQGQSYAKLPAAPRVFTIPSVLMSTLNKKAFDFRDHDILHVKREQIRSLEIAGPEGAYTLTRGQGDVWGLTQPLKTRGGRWTIDSLIGSIENLRMERIAAEASQDLKPFGLDRPARTITLTLADAPNKRLEIGAQVKGEDRYYARESASAMVVVIAKALVDDLAKGLGEWREKRLLDLAVYEIEGIESLMGGAKRVYARSASKDPKEGFDIYHWKRTTPDTKDIETNKVQEALFKMGGIEVQEFIDRPAALANYGLDKPALKATLRSVAPKPSVWIDIGVKDGSYYGKRSDDDAVLRLDSAKADELLKALKEL